MSESIDARLGLARMSPLPWAKMYAEDVVALINQRDTAQLQVHALQDLLYRVIDHHGFNVHTDVKCPEDDTCECPLAVEANALLKGYSGKQSLELGMEAHKALREWAESKKRKEDAHTCSGFGDPQCPGC